MAFWTALLAAASTDAPADPVGPMQSAASDTATGTAAAAAATPIPLPSPSDTNPLEGAEQIREALGDHSMTIGGFINQLDAIGFTLGDTRVSLWSVSLVLLVIVGVVVFAKIAVGLGKSVLKRVTRLSPTQSVLAEKLLGLVVWALAVMIGIDILGIDLTAFAVFSGAFGLAIGFGLQKTFGNLIAGIILLMDRSIKPGDVIAVSDMAGNETFGQIRKIGIRAVSVTTRDEREYLIPNENLMINQVENWSYSSRNVRMQVNVGVSYQCDIQVAEDLMLQAASKVKRVLELPAPSVWLNEYGDSSVNFTIHCWIRDPEGGVGNVRSEVLKNLWYLFQEHGIEIPFPQRDINLRSNEQFEQLISAIAQRLDRRDDPSDTPKRAEKTDDKGAG